MLMVPFLSSRIARRNRHWHGAGRSYTVSTATVVLVVVVVVTLQSATATAHGARVLDQAELSPEAVERIAVWTAEAFPAVEWQATRRCG